MGAYEDFLAAYAAAAPEDRPRLRAAAVGQLGRLLGHSVDRGSLRVTIVEGPSVVGRVLTMRLSVVRIDNGRDVTPVDLNPVSIVNPPLLVPDPAGTIVQHDSDGNVIGTFRFDPLAALLITLRDLR